MTIALPLRAMAGGDTRATGTSMLGVVSRLAAGCAAAAARRLRARQLRTAVVDMDDRMLEDIGLKRAPTGRVIALWRRDI